LSASVTESAATATLKSLRDKGFGIIRDGFGTAWAGLDQLLWFPLDAVRLDPARGPGRDATRPP